MVRSARSALTTATRVGRGLDDAVELAALGGEERRRDVVGVLVGEARAHGRDILAGLLGALDLAAVEDVDGALAAHHRDLGRRPGEVDVGAELLGAHHDVRAAVRLAQ